MRFSTKAVVLRLGVAVLTLSAIRPVPSAAQQDGAALRTPLILDAAHGEPPRSSTMGGALAIIKVDRRNGGSPDLMMGYEAIPSGQMNQAHRHPSMDKIVFVHRGTGTAELGDKTAEVGAGATTFIPQAMASCPERRARTNSRRQSLFRP